MDSLLKDVRVCGDDDVQAGRPSVQMGWYRFAGQFVRGRSVLDAGCGLGDGLRLLRGVARTAHGQDVDERLAAPDVRIGLLDGIASRSYDVVTSIDVIEHIEDDAAFLGHLSRIAREGFFVTTPNWTASRCEWPYHLREYTPREFLDLLSKFGRVTLYKGSSEGDLVVPVRHLDAYLALNDFRNRPATAFLARCLNRVLPRRSKIQNHNAAWVSTTAAPPERGAR